MGLIFATLIVLGAFSLIALLFPKISVAVYLCISVLWPDYIVLAFGEGPGLNPQRLLLPILLATWLIHVAMLAPIRMRFLEFIEENFSLAALLLLFYIWSLISAVTAPFAQSKAVMGTIYQGAFFAFPLFLVSTYFSKEREILFLLGFLVWLVLPIQILGSIEWFMKEIPFAEFVDPASEAASKTLAGSLRLGIYRSTSVFNNPLSYSQFLLFMVPFLCFQAIYGRQLFSRSFALLQCFIIPLSLATTGSRTALICAVLILLAIIWIWISTKTKLAATKRLTATNLAILGCAALSLCTWLLIRYSILASGATDMSTFARIFQLVQGAPEILNAPFLGHGTYNGVTVYGKSFFGNPLTSIDNYYLTVALEQGIVGLILHVAIQCLIIWRLNILKRSAETDEVRNLYRLGIVAFLGLYFFELALSVTEVFSVTYIVAGLLLSLPSTKLKTKGEIAK